MAYNGNEGNESNGATVFIVCKDRKYFICLSEGSLKATEKNAQ